MKTRARSPRRRDMLAALIASVLMGLPPSAHASSLRPTSALVDERCDLAVIHGAVIDDAVAARLRCARLRFLQVLAGRYDRFQPSASEVVARPRPARLVAALAGAPAPPTPTRFAAGAALTSLLLALGASWRRSLAGPAIAR